MKFSLIICMLASSSMLVLGELLVPDTLESMNMFINQTLKNFETKWDPLLIKVSERLGNLVQNYAISKTAERLVDNYVDSFYRAKEEFIKMRSYEDLQSMGAKCFLQERNDLLVRVLSVCPEYLFYKMRSKVVPLQFDRLKKDLVSLRDKAGLCSKQPDENQCLGKLILKMQDIFSELHDTVSYLEMDSKFEQLENVSKKQTCETESYNKILEEILPKLTEIVNVEKQCVLKHIGKEF